MTAMHPAATSTAFYVNAGGGITILESTNGGGIWGSYNFATPAFDLTQPLRTFHIFCAADAILIIGNETNGDTGVIYRIEFDDLVTGGVTEFTRVELGHSILQAKEVDNEIVYFNKQTARCGGSIRRRSARP